MAWEENRDDGEPWFASLSVKSEISLSLLPSPQTAWPEKNDHGLGGIDGGLESIDPVLTGSEMSFVEEDL